MSRDNDVIIRILWVLVFCCAKCHKNLAMRGISRYFDIFEFLQKVNKLCMNLIEAGLKQKNLLPFGGFREVFIAHSFCK